MCSADKLTTFMCRFSGNLGAPTSWSPMGLWQAWTGIALFHRKYSWHSFLLEVSLPQDHSVVGRIRLMKNSSDAIGNRTRAVLQAVARPRAPHSRIIVLLLPSAVPGYLPTIMACCILCRDELDTVIWLELEGWNVCLYFVFENTPKGVCFPCKERANLAFPP